MTKKLPKAFLVVIICSSISSATMPSGNCLGMSTFTFMFVVLKDSLVLLDVKKTLASFKIVMESASFYTPWEMARGFLNAIFIIM